MIKRTERTWLKPSAEIGSLCHVAKNLYNEANYMVRQEFIENGKWIRYNTLAFELKSSENYKTLPAQTAQQILKYIDRSWKSFFKAIKEWSRDKSKFEGRPKLPGYKDKDGEFMLVFTNQQARVRGGKLVFPGKTAVLNGLRCRVDSIQEVRIIPKAIGYVLEVVYEKDIDIPKRDKSRIASIDIGVRNLVTIANNIGKDPIVVKGGAAKSMNQYYNKEKSRIQSVYDKQEIAIGKAMKRLIVSRDKKMNDYLHKVSRAVVDMLASDGIGTLVIGHSNGWKNSVNIGRRNNQSFVSIPFSRLIEMLSYKAEEAGIGVKIIDESYTSKCSFFDGEAVRKHSSYAGKRLNGLFKTAKRVLVNSDVNGAYNILRKAIPNAFADGIEGAVGHPVRLAVSF